MPEVTPYLWHDFCAACFGDAGFLALFTTQPFGTGNSCFFSASKDQPSLCVMLPTLIMHCLYELFATCTVLHLF